MIRPSLAAVAVVLSAAAAAFAAPPAVGQAAPAVSLQTIAHQPVTLADLTKDGPAVVVVLRGWPGYQCPICTKQVAAFRAKAPAFAALGVPVLFVYPGPSEYLDKHAAEFVGEQGMPAGYTLAIDPDYAFTKSWDLRWDKEKETAYPSTFVVDAGGVVRFAKVSHSHGDRTTPDDVLAAAKAAKSPTTRP